MTDPAFDKVIAENPIENGLDAFRAFSRSIFEQRNIAWLPGALDLPLTRKDVRTLARRLLLALRVLPASELLRSSGRGQDLAGDLSRLDFAISDDDFDVDKITSLLKVALDGRSGDALIWRQVYRAVTEATPSPSDQPILPHPQTPWKFSIGNLENTSESRKDVDALFRRELDALHVGLPRFHEVFFGRVPGLRAASEAVFKKCQEGDNPLFSAGTGWRGWPENANQDGVLAWFAKLTDELAAFAKDQSSSPAHRRIPLAQPNKPIQGSTAERKLDFGFVNDPEAEKDSQYHWSQILVPGELKSNPSADTASKAWLDLTRYAREILAAQDTRRFVLGFTLCGSLMRIWEFDRLGGIASESFDINQDGETGLQFVSTILGFLWMDEERLGFDPTITTLDNGRRIVRIQRNGKTERLVLDELMRRASCISGRATTCWKAHPEEDPQSLLVIKDSWQYTERDEEGELLRDATQKGVVNVARYYHHETVHARSQVDDVRHNVRGGLNLADAKTYKLGISSVRPDSDANAMGAHHSGSTSIAGAKKKRSSSQANASLPPSKRSRSKSSIARTGQEALENRVHRRVIVCDYGKSIYKASTPLILLKAFEGCIRGHESLHKAGILHRDISINNLLVNEDEENPSWQSFLIDLDLAIEEQRLSASGAKGKTGTRAFMAIGALFGKQHSFMHDLESFFWVLFWLCIHFEGPGKSIVVPAFERWNYADTEELAKLKLGTVVVDDIFMTTITEYFTPYYQPIIPLMNELRNVVFPSGKPRKWDDERLYSRMIDVLRTEREKLELTK